MFIKRLLKTQLDAGYGRYKVCNVSNPVRKDSKIMLLFVVDKEYSIIFQNLQCTCHFYLMIKIYKILSNLQISTAHGLFHV